MINKDLGMVTAYAYAVSKGYTGTEDQFATLMASYADVGQTAVDAALAAKASEDAAKASETASAASQTAAATSAGTATTAAQTATGAATTATTKAGEAAQFATTAGTAATTATTAASEAAQSATQAAASATAAESAKTAAQAAQTAAEAAQTAAETAQGAAEDAAESVSASVAQIDQNTADISLVKSHLNATEIVDTASGAIATFADGSDGVPVESLTVSMEPIQDLHGQDAPYPAGSGKNLVDWTGPQTITGQTTLVTYETSEQVAFTASVTGYKGNSINGRLNMYAYNGAALVKQKIGVISSTTAARVSSTLDMTGETYDRFLIVITGEASGYSITVSDLQLEKNSTATAYAPYSNICPISGRQSVTVTRAGVNVWDEEWETGAYNFNGKSWGDPYWRCKNPVDVVSGERYFIKRPSTISTIYFYGYDSNMGNGTSLSLQSDVLTVPSGVSKVGFFFLKSAYGTIYNHDISINYPSTNHAYHPGTVQSVTVQLGQTVYGGTVDVVSGVMTVDRAMVDLGTLGWVFRDSGTAVAPYFYSSIENLGVKYEGNFQTVAYNILCSMYKTVNRDTSTFVDGTVCVDGTQIEQRVTQFQIKDSRYSDAASFKTAMDGVLLVYELAQPITITLTPEQLTTILGTNNVWSDADSVSVDYVADTKLYIQKAISAAVAALS